MTRIFSIAFFIVSSACSGNDGNAAVKSTTAVVDSLAPSPTDDPVKQIVLRARALDRANQLDSARTLYEQAAERAPLVKDWLYLRAAGVTRDKTERTRLLDRLTLPVAKDRRLPTVAIAIERSGDVEAAIAAYTAAGDRISPIRLRMLVPTDTARMAQARSALISLLTNPPTGADAREGISLFDRFFKNSTAAETLILARAAYRGGLAARAASAYKQAFAAGLGTSQDRFNNGVMLARLNRDDEAIAAFDGVTTPASLAASARYQRARALLALGRRDAARSALRDITTRYPTDTSAASALYLLADLATDDNRDANARAAFLSLAQRFPRARHAPASLFKAALFSFIAGDFKTAAAEFDSVVSQYGSSGDALAAAYWSGRSWKAKGDTSAANARWRQLLARERSSYYSVLSARRLGVPLLTDSTKDNHYPQVAAVDSASRRIEILKDFGMDTEAGFEYDRLYADAGTSPDRLVATAHALSGTDQSSRSIALGRRAVSEIGPSAQNQRLVYPVLVREQLNQSSRENGLEPALVASLIRQESSFNPRATSPVGARGLMQLMPSVGRTIASSKRLTGYNDESLYDPTVNIKLGTAHMADLFRRRASVEQVLAAYNAGESRVAKWKQKAGAGDPEVFTERIPFVETRDYVRIVVRNREFYSGLYRW